MHRLQDVKARAAGQPLVGVDRMLGHLTISSFHNDDAKQRFNERCQVRICLHTVGTPLADFQSTRELILAFRDAIEGHRQAYELGGVIHRDISEGNVMMARHSARFRGFIHDFDYSFSWRQFLWKRGMEVCLAEWEKYCREHGNEPYDKGKPDESKVRTGTQLFMAIEILRSKVTHEARHDLESFYWLLVYILLRHTNHGHWRWKAAFDALFTVVSWDQAAAMKFCWITRPTAPLTIPGNAPLHDLLEGLRDALEFNFPQRRFPVQRVTHAQILTLFDQALASENWPKDDAALKWVPPPKFYVTEGMVASSEMLMTEGTRGDSTATHSLDPHLGESTFMGDLAGELSDAAGAAIALGGYRMDDETQASKQGSSVKVELPAQTVAGPSRTSHLPAIQHPPRAAKASEPSQPPPFGNQPLPLDTEAEAPDLVADEWPKGRTRGRSTRRAESSDEPRRTGRATMKTTATRKAEETGHATQAEGYREEPAQRYNLRSSNRRDPPAPTTLEAAGATLPTHQRMTRSRPRAAAQTTMAVPAARSRVGKRSRGLEENVDSGTSKRQKPPKQPRVRRTSKKLGGKP